MHRFRSRTRSELRQRPRATRASDLLPSPRRLDVARLDHRAGWWSRHGGHEPPMPRMIPATKWTHGFSLHDVLPFSINAYGPRVPPQVPVDSPGPRRSAGGLRRDCFKGGPVSVNQRTAFDDRPF
jgi:hypothetical protein